MIVTLRNGKWMEMDGVWGFTSFFYAVKKTNFHLTLKAKVAGERTAGPANEKHTQSMSLCLSAIKLEF